MAILLIIAAAELAARPGAGEPAGSRVGAASLAHSPVRIGSMLSPLVALREQLLSPSSRPLFTVRIEGAAGEPAPLRIQVASFGYFDGFLWSSKGAFLVTGGALAGEPVLTHPRLLTEEISITSLPGRYLPVAGWPLQASFAGPEGGDQLGYDAVSGTLVSSRQPWRGLTYMVIAEMSGTSVPASAQPGPLTILSQDRGSPVTLTGQETALVQQWLTGQRTPYEKLTAVARHLRELPYTPLAPPGESYAAVGQLLSGQQPADDGYDEQHAAAFTLIARSLGYPARVVAGYLAQPSHGGVYTVTGADAHAWAEVYFTGYGWVPFDPTNPVANPAKIFPALPAGPVDVSGQPSVTPSATPPPVPVAPAPSRSGGRVPSATGTSTAPGLSLLGWLTAAILAAAALGAVARPLTVRFAAAQRRARRRRGTPAEQIAGAWREAVDQLTGLGVDVGPGMTAGEIAQYARQFLPVGADTAVTALNWLAIAQTRAVFGPGGTPEDAATAWREVRRLASALTPRGVRR